MTSKSTTSPRPLSAQRCASVPPIIPAPTSAIFFLAIDSPSPLRLPRVDVERPRARVTLRIEWSVPNIDEARLRQPRAQGLEVNASEMPRLACRRLGRLRCSLAPLRGRGDADVVDGDAETLGPRELHVAARERERDDGLGHQRAAGLEGDRPDAARDAGWTDDVGRNDDVGAEGERIGHQPTRAIIVQRLPLTVVPEG